MKHNTRNIKYSLVYVDNLLLTAFAIKIIS